MFVITEIYSRCIQNILSKRKENVPGNMFTVKLLQPKFTVSFTLLQVITET